MLRLRQNPSLILVDLLLTVDVNMISVAFLGMGGAWTEYCQVLHVYMVVGWAGWAWTKVSPCLHYEDTLHIKRPPCAALRSSWLKLPISALT